MSTEAGRGSAQGTSLVDTLFRQDRVVITASLELANGRFLQPTGFPDIGPCIYRDKEGRRWCLVESEQSMANRLEAVCMKSPGVWVNELRGLPVIAVYDESGDLVATNLTEPHRIASSYVLRGKINGNNELRAILEDKLGLRKGGTSWALDKRAKLERLVFGLDPAALLHGFQFVQWEFVGLRQTRLLHGRLEAELADEPEVHYGMVKWDAIEPESTREKHANKGQSIAAKSRIVPKEIVATFEIDMLGLKNLALDDNEGTNETKQRFLLALALWKIGAFLANRPSFDPRSRQTSPSLRLRADCYLRCGAVKWAGDSGDGGMTPEHLLGALGEQAIRDLNFDRLVSSELRAAAEDNGAGETRTVYEGPLVEVTYHRNPPAERRQPATQGEREEAEEGEEEDSDE